MYFEKIAMKWIIVALIALTAGWMFFDGLHALATGDYISPSNREYAGQLGPWAGVMRSIGIDPLSTFMKMTIAGLGLLGLTAAAGYASNQPWSGRMLLAFAILVLWYLPFGTFAGILILILFWFQHSLILSRS